MTMPVRNLSCLLVIFECSASLAPCAIDICVKGKTRVDKGHLLIYLYF